MIECDIWYIVVSLLVGVVVGLLFAILSLTDGKDMDWYQ